MDLSRLIARTYGQHPEVRLWHAPQQRAWVGRIVEHRGGVVTLDGARMLPTGLCVGQADFVGLDSTGRFVAVHPTTTPTRPEVRRWLTLVRDLGGLAGEAYDLADVEIILNGGIPCKP